MKTENVKVSYRDKANGTNVSLGELSVALPETIAEAIELFGEEDLIEMASRAYVIDKQREHRDANRPDRPKGQSVLAKFKSLTLEEQENLLAQIAAS